MVNLFFLVVTIHGKGLNKTSRFCLLRGVLMQKVFFTDLDDLIIERPCLEILQNSEVLKQIQIVNGLEKGAITKALNGERVGTIIYKK